MTDSPQPAHLDRSRSYRSIVAGAAAIGLVIVAMTALLILELRHQALESGETLVAALSQVTAEQTDRTFLAADLLLRSMQDLSMKPGLAGSDEFRLRARTQQYSEALARLQTLPPQVDTVGALDENGTVLATSRSFPPPPPLDLSDSRIYLTLRSNPGLGLILHGPVPHRALTKSLVELHDGHIAIDRTLGQGTTVTVTMPIAHKAAMA